MTHMTEEWYRMKAIVSFVAFLALLAPAFAGDEPDKVIGEWNIIRIVDGENQMEIPVGNPEIFAKMTFSAGGKGSASMGKDGKRENVTFTWKRDDAGLSIASDDGIEPDVLNESYEENDRRLILKKSENNMIILERASDADKAD